MLLHYRPIGTCGITDICGLNQIHSAVDESLSSGVQPVTLILEVAMVSFEAGVPVACGGKFEQDWLNDNLI